jgi:neutral trehalase
MVPENASQVREYIRKHWDDTVRAPGSSARGVLDLPHPYASPTAGGAFPFLCYWDTYFTTLGLWADGRDVLARCQADNLAWLIEKYGYVPCYILEWDLTRTQNPVASLFFRERYEREPDPQWLRRSYEAMRREHAFWATQRTTDNGLCRGYFHGSPDAVETFSKVLEQRLGPVPEEPEARRRFLIEALAEAETWDFTPRYDGRASGFNPVDLNAMVFSLESNLAWAARELGDEAASTSWRAKAERRRELINGFCWDEERGCYYDYDFVGKRRGPVLSAAVWFALWAGVPDEDRARRCIVKLGEIEFEHGIAACEPGRNRRPAPCQWDFPNIWPPLQAAAVMALRRYGREEDARRIAGKYLATVCSNFAATGQLWEKYNAVSGGIDVADEYPMPPMMGWTAGVFSWLHAWLGGESAPPQARGEIRPWTSLEVMWDCAEKFRADTHLALRGTFELMEPATVEARFLGASSFDLYLDGSLVTEGPARFHVNHAEYDRREWKLGAGRHVIAVHAHHEGETARLMESMDPFFWCELRDGGGKVLAADWKCRVLHGYQRQTRRISPLLGWIDWCDTAENPDGWEAPAFDDSAWSAPVCRTRRFLSFDPPTLSPWGPKEVPMTPCAEGRLVLSRHFVSNDPSYIFFLRDLEDPATPPQGFWRRYDLGKIRLGRVRLTLDLPKGAAVEIGMSEALEHGRVAPFINCAAGPSLNYDRFIARGGRQTFFPKTPKGGRFVEIHVIAGFVKWEREAFLDRVYFEEHEAGSFTCGDPLLDRIWLTGWETFRSCCEDVIIDNPTRERGQWIGDALGVGLEINSVCSGDLNLVKRSLKTAPLSADSLGRIPGLYPGIREFLPTYGSEWTGANLRYFELSGDGSLLEPLFPAAVRNLESYLPHLKPGGLPSVPGTWTFVDWGYLTETNPFAEGGQREFHASVDLGLTLFYYEALGDLVRWAGIIGRENEAAGIAEARESLTTSLAETFSAEAMEDPARRGMLGYHAIVLAMRNKVVAGDGKRHALDFIKAHLMDCFPNNPAAPRLADTSVMESRLITPSFCHFAFPLLIEAGGMDFVLDQYRRAWGWMLDTGLTTWPEVFDLRWSHCHQWAGCPTWQLSRYGLGLHPRLDIGPGHFALDLKPGSLPGAAGTLPLDANGGKVRVEWSRDNAEIAWRIEPDAPVTLLDPQTLQPLHSIKTETTLRLDP